MAGNGIVRYFRRENEMRQPTLFILLFAALAVPLLAQAKAKPAETAIDRIDRSSGGSIANVRVVSETFKEVTYRKKGSARVMTIPAEEVVDVSRTDTPKELREGKAKVLSGDLKGALAPLQLAARKNTPWVKEYANFYLGLAYARLGNADEAVSAYEAVLAAKPDSRFLPGARLGIAAAWTAAKQYGKAQGVLSAFVREVDAKRIHRQHALVAKQLLGRNLDAQGKYAQAGREYDSVISEAKSPVGRAKAANEKARLHLLALRAQRDKGSSLVRAKKYSPASMVFSQMANTRDDPLARAIGVMGQGEVSLAQGKSDLARVLLSEVSALGFGAEEERPRVLRLLAEAYIDLKSKGEKGASELAQIYIDDLIRNHPGTEDAKAARDLQQKLK